MARMSSVDHVVETVLETLDDAIVDLSEYRTEKVYEQLLDDLKARLGIDDSEDDPEWEGCEDCGSDPCVCDDDEDDSDE